MMSNVTNRTTLEYRRSVNDPDYPDPPWLHNSPQADALYEGGVPTKYWKISGDVVSEMTQTEKDAVDATERDAQRDNVSNEIDRVEDIVRALALTLLDELNNHADKMNEILDAADNATNLADFKARMGAISNYPQRTIAQLKTVLRNKLGT